MKFAINFKLNIKKMLQPAAAAPTINCYFACIREINFILISEHRKKIFSNFAVRIRFIVYVYSKNGRKQICQPIYIRNRQRTVHARFIHTSRSFRRRVQFYITFTFPFAVVKYLIHEKEQNSQLNIKNDRILNTLEGVNLFETYSNSFPSIFRKYLLIHVRVNREKCKLRSNTIYFSMPFTITVFKYRFQ